ncbi:MAG: FAD/NAD(P)-binding oxidoreductase [Patescibacteria group bacterium]
MISVDYLIIGGGIAGTTAAETLRAGDSIAVIAILERELNCLYSRVLIPHYLNNKISREKLFLRSIGNYESQNISLYLNTTVIGIDSARNEVYVVFGDNNQASHETFSYKKLLIASGGAPKDIPIGFNLGDQAQIYRMQTLRDADNIKMAMNNAKTKDVLVLGEGFIAMEFMDVFFTNGFKVHSLCRGGIFGEKKFGIVGARLLEDYYARHGIQFYKNIKDEETEHKDTWLSVNNKPIEISLVGASIGIKRNIDIFTGIDKNIGIVSNEFLGTSCPTIWSAGDVAEYYDVISKKHQIVGNWNNAFMQGHVAAQNMLGLKTQFKVVPTYSIINFDLNITFLGCVNDYNDIIEFVGTVVDPFLFRVLFKNDIVRGAVLINRFNKKARLVQMIEQGACKNDIEKTFYQES